VGAGLTATTGTERLVAMVVDAAQRAIERGDWTEGAALARQLLEIVPDDATAEELLAASEARGRVGAVDQGRRYLTVLFSDIVGSTPLSERLDPEEYLAILTAYREIVRGAVAAHDGHVDQYQGDGAVAYFGFPIASEDDALRAVEAGVDIVREVPVAAERLGVRIDARVGVHVGRTVMTSSDLGARDRNTAVGFATNVAARIQSLAAPGTVVVSETVVDAIAPYFELVPIGPTALRGVSEDVAVHTVAAPKTRSTLGEQRLTAPLVGRRPEVQRIDAGWRAVLEGRDGGRLVVITGAPGLGKSRLVRAAIDRAGTDAAGVLEINCGRDFRHVGPGAIRRGVEKVLGLASAPSPDAVRAALGARGDLIGLSETTISATEALMGVTSPEDPSPALAPDRLREAIIDALVEWVAVEAAARPLLVAVEDVQWADDTTVDVIRRLTAGPLPSGLMVLLTSRTGEEPAALAATFADAMELTALDAVDGPDLVRAFAGDRHLHPDRVAVLAERGEGVPLFTEHLVMAELAHTASGEEPLPATLEGLLQSRLDASGPGRALAEIGAVIGREFSVPLVERVLAELGDRAPLAAADVPAAVRALTDAGLIERDRRDQLRFRHALVLDVAYEMQLRSERPARHRAVARAILAQHGADASPEALAQHHERAGEPELAARAHLRAADAAAELAEFERALEHLSAADGLIAAVDGAAGRRLELARCMQFAAVSSASYGYVGAAEPAYLRALELCDLVAEDGDQGLDVQVAAALGGLASKEVVAGNLVAAGALIDRLERSIVGAPPELVPELRRFVEASRGFVLLFSGRVADAITCLERASAMGAGPVAVRLGVPHDYVAAADALLADALVLAGDDRRADVALARAQRRTADLPFPVAPFSDAVVQVYGAHIARVRGDVAGATARAQRVVEIGEAHGFREHVMLGQILLLTARVMEPDRIACEALESVLDIWRMSGGGLAVPVLLTELAQGFVLVGELERARAALGEARSMMEETGQRSCEPEIHRVAAQIEAAAGAPDAAVAAELCAAVRIGVAGGSLLPAVHALVDMCGRGSGADPDVVAIGVAVRDALPADASALRDDVEQERSASACGGSPG
jgi:class 3 adenylate cyclase/tetratricopeptide (TPR) repeat protein